MVFIGLWSISRECSPNVRHCLTVKMLIIIFIFILFFYLFIQSITFGVDLIGQGIICAQLVLVSY